MDGSAVDTIEPSRALTKAVRMRQTNVSQNRGPLGVGASFVTSSGSAVGERDLGSWTESTGSWIEGALDVGAVAVAA